MKFSLALTITILSCFGLAYLIEPDTTAAPDTITDCTYWQVASENDTCVSISAYWGPIIGFTEAQFVVYVRLSPVAAATPILIWFVGTEPKPWCRQLRK